MLTIKNFYKLFHEKFKIIIIVIVFVNLFSYTATAKKPNRYVKIADKAFENYKYSIAAEKYNKALKKIKGDKDEKNRIYFRMAECYRLTNNYSRALNQFKRLIGFNYQEKNPVILLYYADLLKIMENYNEAITYYNAYQLLNPDDKRADNGKFSCENIKMWLENPTKHQIKELDNINSRESDFAPAYADRGQNTLIFTSTRKESTGNLIDEWTDEEFSDLFVSRIDQTGKWSKPVLLDNENGDVENNNVINTIANEGTPFMNSNFSQMYFTRCSNTIKKASGCQIYYTKRTGRTFSRPELIYTDIDTTVAIGHPTLSSDELTIYFSALRSGGKGGNDIWVATRKNRTEQFGRPKNLGDQINTTGDEVFPFLKNDTLLYFSSNGHTSIGGLDIFVSRLNDRREWEIPQNMGSPMNSNYDDFGIVFHSEKNEGFFSSNRKLSSGDDIYYFVIPPVEFTISGTIKNIETNEPIESVKVSLKGSDGSLFSVLSNKEGYYEFTKSQIKKESEYELKSNLENFFSISKNFNTRNYEESHNFKFDFMLQLIPKEPIVLPEILYDFAKWDLKPEYQDSLQGLIRTLEENENIVIELASHTDSRDTKELNEILSQKRANTVVDYLILRGIHPKRLVPKGYGENQPRKLEKDFVQEGLIFKSGTVLNDDFINTFESDIFKEIAHQLNRRTEFKVLRTDFDLFKEIMIQNNDSLYNPISKRKILHLYKDDYSSEPFADCKLNGHELSFIYNASSKAEIPLKEALKLLNAGIITKNDFLDQNALKNETIENGSEFYIQELNIAGKIAHNLTIKVNNRIKDKLIFGESTLIMFGLFNFDTENQIIIFE